MHWWGVLDKTALSGVEAYGAGVHRFAGRLWMFNLG